MKFGKILGTLAPAVGMATGQGLGGMLGMLSPALMMMMHGMGGHGGAPQGGGQTPIDTGGEMPLSIDNSMMQTGQVGGPSSLFDRSMGARKLREWQSQGLGNYLGRLGQM